MFLLIDFSDISPGIFITVGVVCNHIQCHEIDWYASLSSGLNLLGQAIGSLPGGASIAGYDYSCALFLGFSNMWWDCNNIYVKFTSKDKTINRGQWINQ